MRRVQRLSLHPFELLLISGAFAMPIWVACTEFIAGNRYLPKGNYNLLQFNDWGNLVSMQDALGRAQLAQYAISEYDEEPDDATERRNQLRESSRLLSTVTNLLPDSSFESGTLWLNGIASTGYLGSNGMRVNASTSATFNSSWFYVDIGQSITFSAYVKTSSQNEVRLAIISK